MESGNNTAAYFSLNKLKRVAEYHKDYSHHNLAERLEKKGIYLRDSKEALFFIFSLCFYQGRRDEISKEFEHRAKSAFENYLSQHQHIFTKESERINDKVALKTKYSGLETILQNHRVNKEGDRLMVVSLLNYSQAVAHGNIVKHIVQQISSAQVQKTYQELDTIWSIGPKIAALLLRDIAYIYQLENYLKKDDYNYLQPVDTWVHQIATKLGMTNSSQKKIYKNESIDLTQKCIEAGINPIHFNQGAWYLGANSLEILLSHLDKV